MADLEVGESYRLDWSVEVEVLRRSPTVYEATSWEWGLTEVGPTEAIARAHLVTAIGALWLEHESAKYADEPKDGTRNIVGDEVQSEQLRDTYLGGK